ncbi:hypothetical protein DY000_02036855 [Brassica cretica]|uniref:TPX2 central domain-containing protein n=1 Tax=Brassica cretica TaxID=69181 RepID=A0ABQ7BKB3_BRACR|nr:hypothetical protein DY000_02036855 [Brassica cretica]
MRYARLVNSHGCHVFNPPKARNTRHTITLRDPKAEIFAGEKRNAECFAESRQRQTTAPNFVTHPFTGELQQAISEISSFPFSYILIITNSTPESFHRNHHEISSAESKVRERFQIKPPSTAKDQTTQILKPAVHLKTRYNAGVKKPAIHREKCTTPESATPRRRDHRVPESVPS